MRLVLDTNIVVAGLLWNGLPRQLLDRSINDVVTLYSSETLLNELLHTLRYPKFSKRFTSQDSSPQTLTTLYATLVTLVTPAQIAPTVHNDTDDDAILACAIAAQADLIVSGDAHLLNLKRFQHIPIITAARAIERIPTLP